MGFTLRRPLNSFFDSCFLLVGIGLMKSSRAHRLKKLIPAGRFLSVMMVLMSSMASVALYAAVDADIGKQQAIKETAQSSLKITDLAGREVVLPAKVDRIILGESRYIPALAILDDQPLSKIVGMMADFYQTDPGSYRQYQSIFPEINDIPQVGHTSADSFSVEQVLTLNADVAIFGLAGHGPTARHAQLIRQLERAGVVIVFVDFRRAPLKNTPRSMEVLGAVLNQRARAKEFNAFYQTQLDRVNHKLSALNVSDSEQTLPSVFIHSRVGVQDLCCETMVRGMMASFADRVRGENVAKPVVPGAAGVMNLEYLLTFQPDLYIATAIGSTDTWQAAQSASNHDAPPYIVLGADVSENVARASFQKALSASSNRGIQQLTAVKEGRAFAIWHHFYNTPLNVVAVQAFAKWLYPDTFKSLDPKATMAELFKRFQPVPLDGTYWVSLQAPQDNGHQKPTLAGVDHE